MSSKRKRIDAGTDGEERAELKRLNAACTACRKQKIKCELQNNEPPCSRCQRRDLHCVLHTAQRHPMADYKQIGLLGKDVTNLFSTLEKACDRLGLEAPPPLLYNGTHADSNRQHVQDEDEAVDDTCELSPPQSPSAFQAPIDTYLNSAHHTSPHENSPRRIRRRNSERPDVISKGLITLQLAKHLVAQYLARFDRFLYGIAGSFKDVHEVRHASPTLLAAMCAVAAFHDPEQQDAFELCNREYRALISASLFEKRDLEFIRALCIGSFWLADASRILVSDAIRRSADCRLHLSFHQLTEPATANGMTDEQGTARKAAQDRMRLWYLLYICDQHLSILHNRDSIMREKIAIEDQDLYLAADTTILNQDVRIMSQVSLLVIMGQIRDTLGSEQARPLPNSLSVQVTHFNRELDQWFHRWSLVFEPDDHIGHFPLAGLTMHYNFAKLFLGHQVFRGLKAEPIPLHFLPAAITAREAALTIFTMIVENDAFRSNVLGMPHYFHIMISFAGQFLLEVCMKYREQLNIQPGEDCRKVSAALAVFARTTTIPQHPVTRVTTGLMRKLNQCTTSLGLESVLTDSPFATGDYAAAREPNAAATAGEMALGTQLTANLPDDFMWADLGDFSFTDPQFQFFT